MSDHDSRCTALEAGKHAGPLLEVLDEAARLTVKQGAAAEILSGASPS